MIECLLVWSKVEVVQVIYDPKEANDLIADLIFNFVLGNFCTHRYTHVGKLGVSMGNV